VNGSPDVQECFLLISLFPRIRIPTLPLHGEIDTMPLDERLRVRLLADTVGLMFKPVPKYRPDGFVYTAPEGRIAGLDRLGVRVEIDTLGLATILHTVGAADSTRLMCERIVRTLDFFPAMDYAGRAQPYQGLLRFEYFSSTKIRIVLSWHLPPGFSTTW
jgi:hypothetical protein